MGCTSPFRGSFGNSCCSESGSQKGEGAPASPLPPSPLLGQPHFWGQNPGGPSGGLGGGAVHCILVPSGHPERPSPPPGFQQQRPRRRVGPAGFAQWAERRRRRRPGMEPAALRCAGRLRRAPRPPPESSAGPISGPFSSLQSPLTGSALLRKENGFQGFSRRLAPLPGGRLSSILLPRERDWILLSQPRARQGPLPAAGTGKFPPLLWHPALVAGGGFQRHPAWGAQHPLPRRAESGPWDSTALASRPARPPLGSVR